MPIIDDFLRVTEDVPPRPADAYESNFSTLAFRAGALALLVLVLAVPRLTGKPTLADEQFIAHLSSQPTWSAIRAVISLENRLVGDHLGIQLIVVALHAINAVLFWLILRRLQTPGAWLAAAVFAVHPIAVQALTWTAQQDRLWGAMCYLASVLIYLAVAGVPLLVPFGNSYEQSEFEVPVEPDAEAAPSRVGRFFLHLAALTLFVAGMWFQPTGAAIALALFLLIAWSRPLQRSDWRIFISLGVVATAALVAVIVLHHDFGIAVRRGLTMQDECRSTFIRAGRAAGRVVWPFPAVVDSVDDRVWSLKSSLPTIFLIGILIVLWSIRRRVGSGPALALACFVCLMPTLADIGPAAQFAPLMPGRDACAYLACLPLIAVVVAALACGLVRRIKATSPIAVAGGRAAVGFGLLVPMSIVTWQAGRAYTDTETLWQAASASDPAALQPRVRLAEWYVGQGKIDLAEQLLSIVDPDRSDDVDALLARGRLYEARQNLDGAIRCYVRADRLDNSQRARDRLADAYAAGGDATEAAAFFEKAMHDAPTDAALLNDDGLFLGRRGDHAAAAERFRAAIAADAEFAPARTNLASVLFERGELAEAAEQLQQAVKIDPKNFDAFHNAGIMLSQLKDFEKAEAMLRMAVRLRPDWPEARNDLGVCLVAVGKLSGAVFEFEQALSLRPDYESARHNLQIARQRMISATQPTSMKSN